MAQVVQNKILSGDVIDKLQCSVWDVAGNASIHSDATTATLIADIKNRLPTQQYDFKIGWTGYIDWDEAPFGKYGWTYDETGRFVVCIGDWWGFTRYYNGDVMVWYHKDRPRYVHIPTDDTIKLIRMALEKYIQ